MDGMQDIYTRLEILEAFIIRATSLIGVSLFCLLYIWNHIKDFKVNKRKRPGSNKVKESPKQIKSKR